MSDLIFYAWFWVPLGIGLALQLALFVRMPKRVTRVLLAIVLTVVFGGALLAFLLIESDMDWKVALAITLGTVGPTFMVSLVTYEIAALMVKKTWAKVSVAAVLGIAMVYSSVVFYFVIGCSAFKDC